MGEGLSGVGDVWLRKVVASLAGLEDAVRADEPDAVHRARSQTRRLRVVLGVVPGKRAKTARRRLQQYATLLGAARDLEVYAELAGALIDELGDVAGTVEARERLVGGTTRKHRRAHARIVEFLDSPDYGRMLHTLDLALADAARLDDLVVLHEARKAARSARYLTEAYGDLEKAAASARLQDDLGVHRDNLLLARSLEGEEGVYAQVRERALTRATAYASKSRART